LRANRGELPARVLSLIEERKRLERELSEARRLIASGGGSGQRPAAKDVGGIKFAGRALDNVPAKELKSLADDMKKEIGSGVVALVASAEGKASIVVGVTDDLTKRFNAVDLVRIGAEALGGKGGGGRPDMAQAGGPDSGKADAALAAVERAVAEKAQAAA
jgi:alanyl-tRNA synthetase